MPKKVRNVYNKVMIFVEEDISFVPLLIGEECMRSGVPGPEGSSIKRSDTAPRISPPLKKLIHGFVKTFLKFEAINDKPADCVSLGTQEVNLSFFGV